MKSVPVSTVPEGRYFEDRNGLRAKCVHPGVYIAKTCHDVVAIRNYYDNLEVTLLPPECNGFEWQPEPKYREFADGVEFGPYCERWVRHKNRVTGAKSRVTDIDCDAVTIGGRKYTFSELFDWFEFIDDETREPCGVAQ